MQRSLLEILADPVSKAPLKLDSSNRGPQESIAEGTLQGDEGRLYPIRNGIPRFVLTEDQGQKQTEGSFGFKWDQTSFYNSPASREVAQQWLIERYGFESGDDMLRFFGSRRRILDAGCGGGYSTACWIEPAWRRNGNAEWVGADISTGIDVAQERFSSIPGTHFVQADILNLPFREHSFDTIFSEGVLHHTPSTERAFKSLIPLLAPGGEILFYVYKKKGPIREFTDDYIRDVIADVEPQEAWDMLRPLTKLGKALSDLQVEVEVPEDIPYLNIKAGRYDVQRLIYWHFAKLFWNDAFSFEQNNHANFDWYHPRYAFRHTEEEVRGWCQETGLSIVHFNTQESGFTVRAIKS